MPDDPIELEDGIAGRQSTNNKTAKPPAKAISLKPSLAFNDLAYSLEGYPADLAKLLAVFMLWLWMPDPAIVEVVLATYIANVLPGDPAWLMVIGGPSSGKTECFGPIRYLPHVFEAATLTEGALLSGTSSKEHTAQTTGGLMTQIGLFGILMLKDFTSVLAMNKDSFRAVLAALREIYDGRWTRMVGTEGGKTLFWEGKMGLMAGVTSAIDSHHSIMNSMGERFVFFRAPEPDPEEQARKVNETIGKEQQMRDELRDAMLTFYGTVDFKADCTISSTEQRWLVALAIFAVKCRSTVERDGYGRETELIHQAESPGRLMRVLSQILKALKVIGTPLLRQKSLIVKVGMDCIPPVRRLVLEFIAGQSGPVEINQIVVASQGYGNTTLTRTAEDLLSHGILEKVFTGKSFTWRLTPYWREQHRRATESLPKD